MLGVLIEPFERVALDTVGVWWFVSTLCSVALAEITMYVTDEEIATFDDGHGPLFKVLAAVGIAPVGEEIAFRIGPVLLGVSMPVLLGWNVIWGLLHGKSAPFVLILLPLFLKLVLGGFFVEAVLIHAGHNALFTGIHLFEEHVLGDEIL